MRRGPYRLARRATLTPDRAFTPALIAKMVEDALRPPKGGKARSSARWTTLPEGEREAKIGEWTSILNMRRGEFYYAQEERARKERRDQAKLLVDELRELTPAIVADAEDQVGRFRGDPFSQASLRAARRLGDWATVSVDFLASSVPMLALPPVGPDVRGWQWAGDALRADLEPLLGMAAAARLIASVIPLMTGERPTPASVARQLAAAKKLAAFDED